MAHAVVRTDKLWGTDVRAGLVSVEITENNGIDNGCVATLGALAAKGTNGTQREVYTIAKPTASDDFDAIVMLATPEVNGNPAEYALDAHYNKKGDIARAYRLHKGDIFSVTKEALTCADFEAAKAGDVVELMAGYTLNVVASATSGSTVIGKLLDIEIVGGYTFYVIEVTA